MTKSPKRVPLRARSISVLVPVLNEAENLEPTVKRLIEALTTTIEDYEILIVDDGSTDETAAVADRLAEENPNIRVFHNATNMGLGFAYARGYQEACKEFFVYIPGDNTWPYRSFVELFGNLGRADIITSFAINPGVRPTSRRIVSRAYTQALNFLFRRRMRYFNGLTIYEVDFLRRRPATTFGFGFQSEVLLKALASGASYIEVGLPIDERTAGGSKAINLRNISSVFFTVLRVYWDLQVMKRWRSPTPSEQRAFAGGSSASLDELGFEPDPELSRSTIKSVPGRKIIVIAGASSGIGASLATSLAGAGHTVFACSRSAERLQSAFADDPQVQHCACDVADESQVKAFADFVRSRAPRVDVLINCAGSFGAIGSIDQLDSQAWMRTFQDNLFGTFLTIKNFLPLLMLGDAPQVLNFAGGGAFNPFPNFSAYACSKAAIVRLTETLAVELAPRGITVNAIAPGIVITKVHEGTLEAGAERAGLLQYRRTQNLMRDKASDSNQARMETVQKCVSALISDEYFGLTGKTISANFDPWASDAFRRHIVDITRSELYTMRRTNLSNLPDGLLRTNLMKIWARHGTQR
jgi:NAD(P)-dependent dehydrogenase (short-subunit alcohol dehydrogenase family)